MALAEPHPRRDFRLGFTYDHPTAGPVTVPGNPIKVPGEHYTVYRYAPALGEHTAEHLRSAWLSRGAARGMEGPGRHLAGRGSHVLRLTPRAPNSIAAQGLTMA